jgi:hypothetical protein
MPQREIRFKDLVKTAGKPTIVSLWSDPRRDRPFMKAVKENRVLTLVQEPASKKKDFGRIGFHQEQHAAYLVFPEPLPAIRDSRVIGIKYDLVEQARVRDPIPWKDLKPRAVKTKRPSAQKTLQVIIRRTARIETSVTVEAKTESSARDKAIQQARRQGFDISKAVISDEVMSVE